MAGLRAPLTTEQNKNKMDSSELRSPINAVHNMGTQARWLFIVGGVQLRAIRAWRS
jgi:hypothetical protein